HAADEKAMAGAHHDAAHSGAPRGAAERADNDRTSVPERDCVLWFVTQTSDPVADLHPATRSQGDALGSPERLTVGECPTVAFRRDLTLNVPCRRVEPPDHRRRGGSGESGCRYNHRDEGSSRHGHRKVPMASRWTELDSHYSRAGSVPAGHLCNLTRS